MFEKKITARGFQYLEFRDRHDNLCTLQESSSAEKHSIWLGIDDPDPIIKASDAAQFNIKTDKKNGWIEYPIPDQVSMSTRMHLNKKQSFRIALKLIKFVLFGIIE